MNLFHAGSPASQAATAVFPTPDSPTRKSLYSAHSTHVSILWRPASDADPVRSMFLGHRIRIFHKKKQWWGSGFWQFTSNEGRYLKFYWMNILDNFKLYNKERHFCIFDELYSGTNPYEAVASAYGFLNFISENKNINFMIKPHQELKKLWWTCLYKIESVRAREANLKPLALAASWCKQLFHDATSCLILHIIAHVKTHHHANSHPYIYTHQPAWFFPRNPSTSKIVSPIDLV